MIGLLGTVTGMISTFKALVVFGASDPANLAGGISEALITTQAGLLVAVPALLMRGLLGALSDSALSKLEGRAMSLVLALRGAPKPPSPPPPADREPVEDGARPLPGAQAPEPPASEAPEPKAVLEGNADWEK